MIQEKSKTIFGNCIFGNLEILELQPAVFTWEQVGPTNPEVPFDGLLQILYMG